MDQYLRVFQVTLPFKVNHPHTSPYTDNILLILSPQIDHALTLRWVIIHNFDCISIHKMATKKTRNKQTNQPPTKYGIASHAVHKISSTPLLKYCRKLSR